jgi:hypothetical protein
MIERLRGFVGSRLYFNSIKRTGSRLHRRSAARYTEYLRHCRQCFVGDLSEVPEVIRTAEQFASEGVAQIVHPVAKTVAHDLLAQIREEENQGKDIWDDSGRYSEDLLIRFPTTELLLREVVEPFLMQVYRTHYKIFYGMLYRSVGTTAPPDGSQLWHADGGPGTCIIVMLYLSEAEKPSGALECLPWRTSLEIFKQELTSDVIAANISKVIDLNGRPLTRDEERAITCSFYEDQINARFSHEVIQPTGQAGLVVPFRNNLIHRGGHPISGKTRYVCLFHCYPSDHATPYERYMALGIKKTASRPDDPAAVV